MYGMILLPLEVARVGWLALAPPAHTWGSGMAFLYRDLVGKATRKLQAGGWVPEGVRDLKNIFFGYKSLRLSGWSLSIPEPCPQAKL